MGCYSSKPVPHASTGTPKASSSQASGCNGLMSKTRVLLQALMTLKGPDAASQAAEIILKQLGCGNVSIIACTSKPDLFLRLSGKGMFPARTYHRSQVLLSSDSCAAGLFRTAGSPPAALYRTVRTADEAANLLPKDWEQEYHHSGMRTFLAVPIIAHSNEHMLGVLTLSSCQPGAFWESWWEPLMGIVSAGLVPLMQESLTQGLVELAMHVLSTASVSDFVMTALQRTTLLLESIYNTSMSVRLGLLSPDHHAMLLLLPPQLPSRGNREGNSGMTISCGSLSEDLRIMQLPTSNTLLMEALSQGQPRVVSNTAHYLEGSTAPSCQDVFVDTDDVVSSITAAPLLAACRAHTRGCSCCGTISHGQGIADVACCSESCGAPNLHSRSGSGNSSGSPSQRHAQQQMPLSPGSGKEAQWYGCLYVAHQSPYGFEVELPAIVALSKILTVLMMQCLPASMAWRELSDARAMKQSVRHHSTSSSSTISSSICSRGISRTGSPDRPAQDLQCCDSPTAGHAAAAGDGDGGLYVHIRRTCSLETQALTPPSGSSPISAMSAPAASSRHMATSSIVETLRRQVQHARDLQVRADAGYVQELQLQRFVGKGAFGTVYAGTWQGSPVAVKLMYVSQHERQLMKTAMEMAVLTSIQHPNMVRVYACLTDLLEEAGPLAEGCCNPLLSVRYRPFEGSREATAKHCLPHTLCNIVVMELCDKGNLHQAMRQGLLHKRLANKGLVVDMRLLNTVLLQVAHSLLHLHEHGVIHSDVKCENVLLMTSSSSPVGFICKLGDFGLVRLLLGNSYLRNRSGSGTVAYQAPEVFEEGSKLTPAVDVYAFGIMMYELYACRRPYTGMAKDTIAKRVSRRHQRPHFPPGTWTQYQRLAEACWDPLPSNRPHFGEIIRQLQLLLDAAGGPFTCSSPLGPGNDRPPDSIWLA